MESNPLVQYRLLGRDGFLPGQGDPSPLNLVAKYFFIFNRVLCCKIWKNETLIGITKMGFSKALFL